MALKIELKPGEKVIVNGAVMAAGRSGASLVLHNKAVLLRGKDVMQESDADTPAKRLYFSIMLMYIDASGRDKYRRRFDELWDDYNSATTMKSTGETLRKILQNVETGDFYNAMKECKNLIAFEAKLLGLDQKEKGR
ncbi:MAG: flagellar biosynthesis repressor FlbT [Rhodospirillales bacterium]|nr:flagellar biosynthesis repressor FlbT [Rhodospirillales bacterium]